MKIFIKNFFVALIVILLTTTYSAAAKKKEKKDCTYCNKYEKLKDWPLEERPEAFIYEEIDYPEGMFLPTSTTLKKNKEKLEEKFMQDLLKKKDL